MSRSREVTRDEALEERTLLLGQLDRNGNDIGPNLKKQMLNRLGDLNDIITPERNPDARDFDEEHYRE